MGVMMLILGTLTSYVFQQSRYGRAQLAREQALHIAEAGLEYYRWFLAHNPGDLTNGTGAEGPYTYAVEDPEGGEIGEASLTVTGNTQCGVLQHIDIESRGTSHTDEVFPRTISVRHMRPSVAEYAWLLNTNVHYSSSYVGTGPHFSNGGIRMDGTSNSTVTSALESFTCDPTMGCSPSQTKPGVFGNSAQTALWQFPATSVDFSGMATNFGNMKTYAQLSGRYFYDASVSANPDSKGFRMVLKANGTFDVYTVTGTASQSVYRIDINDYYTNHDVITSQTFLGNYTVPTSCALVYVEGTLWLEGTVSGRLTVIAADPSGSYAPDIILAGDIAYATTDGTTGLTAIAEHSIRIPINSPNTLNLRGIFVAQTGYFGRDYYYTTSGYDSSLVRSGINAIATFVSAARPITNWGTQGYTGGSTYSYDRVLAFDPPPFTPSVSADYHYVLWNEQ
jgi:hypothetical protein